MILVSFAIFMPLAEAKQVYNAFENRWETVPDQSNWGTKYNAMENNWSYQPENSTIEYNAFEDTWDWDSGYNYESR